MTEQSSDTGPTIPGPYLSPQQTETSPLRQSLFSSTKKSIENWLWGWDFTLESTGSLKSVVVFLFGTAGVVTLALLTQIYYGESQITRHGAVVTDHANCTEIGISMLQRGGHAVDAAVAAAMCLGVVHFHVTGLGGGGLLLAYNQRRREVFDVVDFKSSAPTSSGASAYDDHSPGQTVGVPGFLAGLYSAHQRHGRLPWSEIVLPSVLLARNGFKVTTSLATAISCLNTTQNSKDLKGLLESFMHGGHGTLPSLATTLEVIASNGADVFYHGSLADDIVYTVKKGNGSMEHADLASYSPTFGLSEKAVFQDFDIIVPASFGGIYLLNALEAIQDLDLEPREDLTAEMVRKISDRLFDTQATLIQKSPKVKQMSEPADSSVAVMDSEDNYVSIVSGLNSMLGSQLLTSAGFVLNNLLVNGETEELSRPVSMATPVVAVQRGKFCGQRIVAGSADARSLAQVLTQLITFQELTNFSVEAPRFHLGTVPRSILLEDQHEPQLSDLTVTALKGMTIAVSSQPSCPSGFVPYNSVNVVSKVQDVMWPYADSRGEGEAQQF